MSDKPMCLHLFEFDSGFSRSDDVDKIAVDDDEMDADVEGSGNDNRMNANVESSGFAQQLARLLLNFFVRSIVCMWKEWGLYISFIVQC